MKKKEPIGLDLVDDKPDYSKSLKKNIEISKKRYEAVYGEYPMSEEEIKKLLEGDFDI